MGDRCYVELTILKTQYPQVDELLETLNESPSSEEAAFSDVTLFVLGFEEVNGGTLEFLPQLEALGIAYDSRWSGGDEYGAGIKHLRFAADGTIQTVEYSDTEQGNIETSRLLEFMSRPEVTADAIHAYIINHVDSFNPLPWEGQEENSKRHRALKLIGGT